jgi:thiamine kinase-like enzyme
VHPAGYEAVIDRLARLPTTLVHGELYASNVMLADDRVCVVDWELAGVGPGVLDLAALTLGLADNEAAALVETYRLARDEPLAATTLGFELDCARLHVAIQWLGWSPDWTPPPEHARDWRAELPRLVERAGL